MSSLAICVVALLAGCLAGGSGQLAVAPVVTGWGAAAGAGSLVLAARLGWAGHTRLARALAVAAAVVSGVALGVRAEAAAWAPAGPDVAALEEASWAASPLQIDGQLRRDAWVAAAGGVALDLEVRRVRWRGAWHATRFGMRATVVGKAAASARIAWTRGRRIQAVVGSLRRPLPYRNFETPDAERALARRGLRLFGTIKSAALVETTPGPWWEEAAARARLRVRHVITAHVPDPAAAATTAAILIGDRSNLDATLVRDLQHAGVYHVVAISGGNVGIWLALLMWLPRAAGAGARVAMLWLAGGLLGFAVVVDGGASVARAATVASVVVAARWWDVRASAAQALLLAAGLQWLANPLAWHDAGCVLSFGAAGTLVALAWLMPSPSIPGSGRSWWSRLGIAVLALMAATLAVELVLLPITARWFHVATAAGLLANVVAVPAMAVVQVAGMALIPAAAVWGPCGDAVGAAATLGVRALVRSADIVSLAPWLVREVPPPPVAVLAVYYVALAATAAAWLGGRRIAAGFGAIVTSGGLIWIVTGGVEGSAPSPWSWPSAARWQRATWPSEPWLLISILDVGQGDATVIRFPSGRTWLVDAGGSVADAFDVGARVTTPALWALGTRRLDRVVVTHAHPDHAAGLPTVIRRFRPREIMAGIAVTGDRLQAAVSDAAMQTAARERSLSAGERLPDGRVGVSVLHPERPDWQRRRVRNDDSVVLWVRFGDVGFWLPGDVGAAVEARLAPRVAAAPLTVLRLAHHGSSSSTSAALLHALQPSLAVGSMGRGNRFGHPAPVVITRLQEHRVPLLRTDDRGAIQLATNGRILLVRTASGLAGTLTSGPPRRAWWLATPPPSVRASHAPEAGPPPRAAPRPR